MKPLVIVPKPTPNFFARAVFAVAMARVNRCEPDQFIRKDDKVTPLIIERAAVSPGATTTVGFGAEVTQDALRNYLVSLAPYSAAARLISQAIVATTKPYDEIKYPVRAAGAVAPAFVLENGAIPVRSSDFDLVTVGPARKMAHILVWSRELGKRPDAEAIFEQMLREDVVAGIDGAFFATSAGSATQPAGLLYGASNTTGYAGADRLAIEEDLLYLSDIVSASGNVTYVMGPKRVARLRVRAPDIFAQTDVVASAAVPETRIVAVDPVSVIIAIDQQPEIQRSEEATIHMSDTPLPISESGVADPVRSLFQTASVAARVIHEIDFTKRRTDAAAYVENPTW